MNTRRDILRAAAQSGVLGAALSLHPLYKGGAAATGAPPPYGAAVSLTDLKSDATLAQTLAARCDLLVPVSELKWSDLRPGPDQFDFSKADALALFADQNNLRLRGHTLAWYAAMPRWTQEINSAAEAERVLEGHIHAVVSRYRGRILSWDVVNEAVPDSPKSDLERRPCLWSKWLQGAYIPLSFRFAAEADPGAQLVLNDYDVEFADGAFLAKRAALRRLVLDLLDRGAPLHGIGLQCHLRGAQPIDRDGLERFVVEMRRLGLAVLITELDVMDQDLPGPTEERDRIIASQVSDLLSAASAPAPLDAVLTWGISDRYSWISHIFPRKDGLPNRPLPLDAAFAPKLFMEILHRFAGRRS